MIMQVLLQFQKNLVHSIILNLVHTIILNGHEQNLAVVPGSVSVMIENVKMMISVNHTRTMKYSSYCNMVKSFN